MDMLRNNTFAPARSRAGRCLRRIIIALIVASSRLFRVANKGSLPNRKVSGYLGSYAYPLSVLILCYPLVSICGETPPELVPDYYDDAGINPYRNNEDQSLNEFVDPFSGSVHLNYVDVFVPGNGGMDIRVLRSYSSINDILGRSTPFGIGWTMHFGRVSIADQEKLCSAHNTLDEDVRDNPVIEWMDGGVHQLFYTGGHWITRERWRADCPGGGGNGLIVTTTDGTKYYMDRLEVIDPLSPFPTYIWHTTKIVDIHGNQLTINYKMGGALNATHLIDSVTSSDGSVVNFAYNYDAGNSRVSLKSISANGQQWNYQLDPVADNPTQSLLKSVTRPDGLQWQYSYYSKRAAGVAGSYCLRQVTYPYGGTILYQYDYVRFSSYDERDSTVATQRVTGGRAVNGGAWSYSYHPGGGVYSGDRTIITGPDGIQEKDHMGVQEGLSNYMYAIGMPLQNVTKSPDGTVLLTETFGWIPQRISDEDYTIPTRTGLGGAAVFGNGTYAAIQRFRSVTRDGAGYNTVYAPSIGYDAYFDDYGNPLQVDETGNATRHRDFTYYHAAYGTSPWLVTQIKDEYLRDVDLGNGTLADSTVIRTFDAGDLTDEVRDGKNTHFTYHPPGDVLTITDPRAFTKTFDNYKNGKPQLETHETGTGTVTIQRVVNDTGTVQSETNGRNYTTGYGYDDLNRLTAIDYPLHSDVTIDYNLTDKVLTRGAYSETTQLDGMARPVCIIRRDNALGTAIARGMSYDPAGRLIFESYPVSGTACQYTTGTQKDYDALGRVTKITHQDNSFKLIEYVSNANKVRITDERGKITTYSYLSYGNPDEKYLTRIDQPDNNTTLIFRNHLGQITKIHQGQLDPDTDIVTGQQRTYLYDNRFLLFSETNPETGTTTYIRDNNNNIESRTTGGLQIGFIYDGMNRLKTVDYPADPDVIYEYDNNGNLLSASTSAVSQGYSYDANDNLKTETLNTVGKTFSIGYDYDNLDFHNVITYPSGRTLTYQPDALGRPTKAAPYVTAVSYHPTNQPASLTYANGVTAAMDIDPQRLWTTRIHTSGAGIIDLDYSLRDLTGNPQTITDNLDATRTADYLYDDLGRLETATGMWGSETFQYDHLGNIDLRTLNSDVYDYSYASLTLAAVNYNGNYTYYFHNGQGHIEQINNTLLGLTTINTYNDDGDLVGITRNGTSIRQFAYDSNHTMVSSTEGGVEKYHMYSRSGILLGDYNSDSTTHREYFHLFDRQVAVWAQTPPVANAGTDFTVLSGKPFTLDGTGSSAPNSTISGYQWAQTQGINTPLTNSTQAVANATAPSVGTTSTLQFKLTVTDNIGSAQDTVTVTVLELLTDSENGGAGDGLPDNWEIYYFGDINSGPNDDPDNDGITNLQEFEEDTDPTVAQPAPQRVQQLSVSPGDGQITLIWDEVRSASGYRIYWSTNPGVTPSSGTLLTAPRSPYAHTGLTNGTQYYYLVVAFNNSGTSPMSPQARAIPGARQWTAPEQIPGGVEWAVVLSSVADGGDVCLDDADGVMSVWEDTSSPKNITYRTYSLYSGWSAPDIVDIELNYDAIEPRAACDDIGNSLAIWRQHDGVRWNLMSSFFDRKNDIWLPPGLIDSYNGSVYEHGDVVSDSHKIIMNGHGQAMAAWLQEQVGWYIDDPGSGSSSPRKLWSNVYNRHSGWSGDRKLDAGSFIDFSYDPHLSINPDNRTCVTWDHSTLYKYSHSDDSILSACTLDMWPASPVVTKVDELLYPDQTSGTSTYQPFGFLDSSSSNNNLYLWLQYVTRRDVMSRYKSSTSGFSPAAAIDRRTQDASNLVADSNSMLNTVALWEQAGSIWVNHYRNGAWTTAAIENNLAGHEHQIAVNEDGTAIVALESSTGNISVTHYSEAQGWSVPITLDNGGKLYALKKNRTSGAVVTWAKNQSMWISRYAPPDQQANVPPVASISAPSTVSAGATVTLDASASTDDNGVIMAYDWTQTAGPAVAINAANTSVANFAAPLVTTDTTLTFELALTDDDGATVTTPVSVTVITTDSDTDGMADEWELQYFGTLAAEPDGDADGDGDTNLTEFQNQTDPLEGDINANGAFNVGDLLLATRHVLGYISLDAAQIARADLHPAGGDGQLTTPDLLLLQQRVMRVH
jgi:YD repeat-containing protein